MSTALDVMDQFRSTSGFYPAATAAQARLFFDKAYKYLLSRIEARNSTVVVTSVADQATYDMPVTTWKTFSAYWETGSDPSNWIPIASTSTDVLDANSPGWRMIPSTSYPSAYYITSAPDGNSSKPMIGLYPPPSETATGGYPRLRMYVTEYATIGDSDEIPQNLLNDECILYKMAELWAVPNDPQKVGYWKQLATEAISENMNFVQDQQLDEANIRVVSPFTRLMGRAK
jgi:hypothetical protein